MRIRTAWLATVALLAVAVPAAEARTNQTTAPYEASDVWLDSGCGDCISATADHTSGRMDMRFFYERWEPLVDYGRMARGDTMIGTYVNVQKKAMEVPVRVTLDVKEAYLRPGPAAATKYSGTGHIEVGAYVDRWSWDDCRYCSSDIRGGHWFELMRIWSPEGPAHYTGEVVLEFIITNSDQDGVRHLVPKGPVWVTVWMSGSFDSAGSETMEGGFDATVRSIDVG